MKKFFFYILMLVPLFAFAGSIVYLLLFTNLPQQVYARSIRNIYFDCMIFVSDPYVYKLRAEPCKVKNIEYDITLTQDSNGFRNGLRKTSNYEVVVIGDSHAHGVGVQDNETFASLLETQYGYKTENLAIGSYATMRELEALAKYGANAKYVVVQYCDNDGAENDASLRLGKEEFRSEVEKQWKGLIATYFQGKSLGYKKPIDDAATSLLNLRFISKSAWQEKRDWRKMELEASLFARVVARYRDLLEGKRLIIFEVASWGANSPKFEATFDAELSKISWLSYKLINSADILDFGDYFFLDDHITANGHRKLAAAIKDQIGQWERKEPLLQNH